MSVAVAVVVVVVVVVEDRTHALLCFVLRQAENRRDTGKHRQEDRQNIAEHSRTGHGAIQDIQDRRD